MSLVLLDKNVCTREEYKQNGATRTCLTKADSLGLSVIAEAGLLSLFAILCLFAMILRNVRWRVQNLQHQKLRLFHQPMDILIFSILIADILQGVGMVLNLKWIILGKVELGDFCDSQRVIKALGSTAVALSTLAIAVFTFLAIWLNRDITSMGVTWLIVLAFWVADVALVIIGPLTTPGQGKLGYTGLGPYWCSINKYYLVWKVVGEYLWRWLTLVLSILLYIPLYLWMRGNLEFDENHWWRIQLRWAAQPNPVLHVRRRKSLIMLLYPFVYCILVLPMSIVRWVTWWIPKYPMSPTATLATNALFALSGFFNVVVLVTTRPESGLFGQLMFRSPVELPEVVDQNKKNGQGETGGESQPSTMEQDDPRSSRLPE